MEALFRQSFPKLAGYADQIPLRLHNPVGYGYRSTLLVAENTNGRVDAFALVIHFPDAATSFLDFIASRNHMRGGGIGSALYESVRELCQEMGSKGLYIEVEPDSPELNGDPSEVDDAKKRIRFYEQYGVRIIDLPAYSLPVGKPPTSALLLFDGLGRTKAPGKAEAQQSVERILSQRFGHVADRDYIQGILNSFQDDPVKFLPARTVRALKEAPLGETHRLQKPFVVVDSPKHELHHVKERGYFERPIRVEAIHQALHESSAFRWVPPKKYGDSHLFAVHEKDFVYYLRTICTKLKEKRPVYPNTFPLRRLVQRPKVLAVQAGYYCIDTGTPLYPNAYIAARATVDTALTAADEILSGNRLVYAVCRPPGHHAGKRFYGGFCYFNNAAIAAHYLSSEIRVAILDMDFHHGNGTQDIFYERDDVFTLSIHGHPDYAYPYFSGYRDETGQGRGLGLNRNFPLAPHTDEKKYLVTFSKALDILAAFKPETLVVSLGFDVLKGDPTGTFLLKPTVFQTLGRMLMSLNLPILIIQEGGYSVKNIKRGCAEFFKGVKAALPEGYL